MFEWLFGRKKPISEETEIKTEPVTEAGKAEEPEETAAEPEQTAKAEETAQEEEPAETAAEPEQTAEPEETAQEEETAETAAESEQTAQEEEAAEAVAEPEQTAEPEETVQADEAAEEAVEPEQTAEPEETAQEEEPAETAAEPEQTAQEEETAEAVAEPEQTAEPEETVQADEAAEEAVEPEQTAEAEESTQEEETAEAAVEPEQTAEAEETVQTDEVAEEAVEPEQIAEAEETVQGEETAETAVGQEQAEEAEETVQSEEGNDFLKKDSKDSKKEGRKGKEKKHRQKSVYDRKQSSGKKRKKGEKQTVFRTVDIRRLRLGEGIPAICVPLTGSSKEEILAEAAEAVRAGCDMAEWRADYFDYLDDPAAAADVLQELRACLGDCPLLFTVRTEPEGGMLPYYADRYEQLIRWAVSRPETDLIDIEVMHMDVDAAELTAHAQICGKKVISSAHFFRNTPKKEELRTVFDREERTGADILKVAAMPQKPKDVLRMMQVSRQIRDERGAVLCSVSMGDLGRISRVSGRVTGSALTFGTAGQTSAPGQIPIEELRAVMQVL